MFFTYSYVVIALVSFYLVSVYVAFRENRARARKSGLKVYSCPAWLGSPIWGVTSKIALPIFYRLPRFLTKDWIDVVHPNWPFHEGYGPFERRGLDIIINSCPGGIAMSIADPIAIADVSARRHDFQKPIEVYAVLNVFGPNIISSEGHVWRDQRKIIAPAFSEKNNALVWRESLNQGEAMLRAWARRGDNTTKDMLVSNIQDDAATVALHVISNAGFGVPLFWPGDEVTVPKESGLARFSSHEPPKGHVLTFKDALNSVLEDIMWFLIFSPETLRRMPFKKTKRIQTEWAELDQYWRELLAEKKKDVKAGNHEKEKIDLMIPMVEAAIDEDSRKANDGKPHLTDTQIMGNVFILMFAGHETSANTINNALILLAMNRPAQEELHRDLDRIIGEKPPKDWDYSTDCDRLFNSLLGATINEALRLIPPVIHYPKAAKDADQPLAYEGGTFIVPKGTFFHINTFCVHRNPKYWPHSPSSRTGAPTDLNDFEPRRWLTDERNPASIRPATMAAKDGGDAGMEIFSETSKGYSTLFTPRRGAFTPFSDGHRACIGRRFTYVELTAVLGSILQTHSVELAVDEWASDAEVARMTVAEKKAVYAKAVERAYWKIEKGSDIVITLKLKPGNEIPVRIVERGRERFRF